jgi:hypothetical protein
MFIYWFCQKGEDFCMHVFLVLKIFQKGENSSVEIPDYITLFYRGSKTSNAVQ